MIDLKKMFPTLFFLIGVSMLFAQAEKTIHLKLTDSMVDVSCDAVTEDFCTLKQENPHIVASFVILLTMRNGDTLVDKPKIASIQELRVNSYSKFPIYTNTDMFDLANQLFKNGVNAERDMTDNRCELKTSTAKDKLNLIITSFDEFAIQFHLIKSLL